MIPSKPPPNPKPYHLKRKSDASSSPMLPTRNKTDQVADKPPPPITPPPPYLNKLHKVSSNDDYYIDMNGTNGPVLPPRTILREYPHQIVNGSTLQAFIDANTKNLPVKASVDTGLYGPMSDSSLYQEKVTFHFEMKMKVVTGTIDKAGRYCIPLCSSIHFSLLHNPTDNIQQAMLGHYYETVGHILAQPDQNRPKVVCVTRSISGTNAESSVQHGDILLVSPRVHTRTFKQGKFLKCIHATTGEVKMLHENCLGGFTTQPDSIKMLLKDFWGHKYCPIPLKVVVHHSLPQVVLPQCIVMTLTNEVWEDSIIATHEASNYNAISKTDPTYNTHTLRILKDVGILVVTDNTEDEAEYILQLRQQTHDLFTEFTLSRVHQHLFVDDPVWPNFEEVQSMFYKNVLFDTPREFVQLKKPDFAFKAFKRQKSLKAHSLVDVDKSEGDRVSPNSIENKQTTSEYSEVRIRTRSSGPNSDYALLSHTNPQELGESEPFFIIHDGVEVIPDVARLLHEVNTANRQMMIHVEGLRAEVEGLKLDLRQTKTIMGAMKRELYDMIGRLDSEVAYWKESMDDYISVVKREPLSVEAENREILKAFTSAQILQALDILKLGQYKEIFRAKKITGLELVHYNDHILLHDLNITNGSDRIRLVLFIEGREAVWKLLEEDEQDLHTKETNNT